MNTVDTSNTALSPEQSLVFWEASKDLFCTVVDGRFQAMNAAWEKTLGWTREELRTHPVAHWLHPDDVAVHDANSSEPPDDIECRHRHKDGRWVVISWSGTVRDDVTYSVGRPVSTTPLVQAHHRLRSVLDTLPVAIAYWGLDQRCVFANDGFKRWGLTQPRERDRRTFEELLPPRVYALNRGHMEAALRGEPQQFERQLPASGMSAARDVLSSYVPLIEEGAVVGVCTILTDVTHLKRTEKANDLLRVLNDHNPSIMTYWDNEFRCQVANAAWRTTGVDPDWAVGRRIEELASPDNLEKIRTYLQRAMQGEHQEFQRSFQPTTGGPKNHLLTRYVPHVVDNAVAGVMAFVVDVTAVTTSLEALRHSEEALRMSQTMAHVGHWTWDIGTGAVEFSDELRRILGSSPNELGNSLANIIERVVHPDDLPEMRERLRRATQHGAATEGLFRVIAPGGTIRQVWMKSAEAELDENGRAVRKSGVMQDVTVQKAVELELEAANRTLVERIRAGVEELRAKDEMLIRQGRQAAMGEMLGNIAHQWRQPLNALGLVFANVADLHRLGQLNDPAMKEAAADANMLVQSMSATINSFRDFFRPGKEKAPFSAVAAVRGALALVEESFRHASIEFDFEFELESDVMLIGLPNEYSQVVLNLLSNAKQAIEALRGRSRKITVRLEKRDGQVELRVRDTGGGVPPDIIERLFEPYFTTKADGSGIGLYMSRQIIEKGMGGKMSVRNVEGGAEFVVSVPAAAAETTDRCRE